eukprot:scaffold396_cov127-Isochrysis_galbana.AAC.4
MEMEKIADATVRGHIHIDHVQLQPDAVGPPSCQHASTPCETLLRTRGLPLPLQLAQQSGKIQGVVVRHQQVRLVRLPPVPLGEAPPPPGELVGLLLEKAIGLDELWLGVPPSRCLAHRAALDCGINPCGPLPAPGGQVRFDADVPRRLVECPQPEQPRPMAALRQLFGEGLLSLPPHQARLALRAAKEQVGLSTAGQVLGGDGRGARVHQLAVAVECERARGAVKGGEHVRPRVQWGASGQLHLGRPAHKDAELHLGRIGLAASHGDDSEGGARARAKPALADGCADRRGEPRSGVAIAREDQATALRKVAARERQRGDAVHDIPSFGRPRPDRRCMCSRFGIGGCRLGHRDVAQQQVSAAHVGGGVCLSCLYGWRGGAEVPPHGGHVEEHHLLGGTSRPVHAAAGEQVPAEHQRERVAVPRRRWVPVDLRPGPAVCALPGVEPPDLFGRAIRGAAAQQPKAAVRPDCHSRVRTRGRAVLALHAMPVPRRPIEAPQLGQADRLSRRRHFRRWPALWAADGRALSACAERRGADGVAGSDARGGRRPIAGRKKRRQVGQPCVRAAANLDARDADGQIVGTRRHSRPQLAGLHHGPAADGVHDVGVAGTRRAADHREGLGGRGWLGGGHCAGGRGRRRVWPLRRHTHGGEGAWLHRRARAHLAHWRAGGARARAEASGSRTTQHGGAGAHGHTHPMGRKGLHHPPSVTEVARQRGVPAQKLVAGLIHWRELAQVDDRRRHPAGQNELAVHRRRRDGCVSRWRLRRVRAAGTLEHTPSDGVGRQRKR